MTVIGTKKPPRVRGRTGPLCPGSSDLNFLGDLKGIVDIDTKMPHGAFDPLNSRAKVAPRAGCRSGDRLTSPWFDAWNAWRTCSGRGRCHGPTWIRGEHTVACSRAGPNLGLLGIGIRRLCDWSHEGSCPGPRNCGYCYSRSNWRSCFRWPGAGLATATKRWGKLVHPKQEVDHDCLQRRAFSSEART